MLKVLHVITGLGAGGAENMLLKIISASDRKRFFHSVISMLDEGTVGRKIQMLGCPVYTLNMRRSFPSPLAVTNLKSIVRLIQPDVIQGWMYHGNLLSMFVSRQAPRSVPVIWNIRQSLYSLTYEKLLTRFVIKCGALLSHYVTRILYNSRTSARQHENNGYSAKKRIVIPNGFDTDIFCPSEEARRSVRMELGLKDDTLLIGLIGRFHAMKDHNTFFKAAKILHQNYPAVHFLLAGTDVTYDNEQIRVLISQCGITENVHLLGERHDIPRLTASLDCAALSSFSESFPNVVGEAMSCCVPCAVTDVGDASWIIGDTGIVVPPRNPEALSSAWSEMIVMNSDRLLSLGNMARKRIIKYFSIHSIVKQYEQLYKQQFNLPSAWRHR